MASHLDKQIIVDVFCGYDGPIDKSLETYFKENEDPIFGEAEIEQIVYDLETQGKSRLAIVKTAKALVKTAREYMLPIEDVLWTNDDYFEVAQSVAKKLLPRIKKQLRRREVECRLYETGVVEFRRE